MVGGQSHLLKTKRFLPLLITQFSIAFNDNFFRTALITLITYRAYHLSEESKTLMVTIAIGIFMLPFFLFSTTGGQLANKYNKATLIRWIKFFEIVIMGLGSIGFVFGNITFLLFVLFLMGTQSALFGPVKYSILPDHLAKNELIGANGFVEAGTFLSILLGTIFGSMVIAAGSDDITTVSILIVAFAFFGFVSSLFIPDTEATQPEMKFTFNIFKETKNIISITRRDENIFNAIIAISWFWLVGAIFLAQIPNITSTLLHASQGVFTLLLAIFSVGIGLGSLCCNTLLKGEISTKYVPISSAIMALFMADFTFTLSNFAPLWESSASVTTFASSFMGWRIIVDLLMISFFGGVYTVPLYTTLQSLSNDNERSQVIAANNIISALFMVLSSLIAMIILKYTASIDTVFMVLTISHALMTAWLFYQD